MLLFVTFKLSVATLTVMTSYQQLSLNVNRLMSMTVRKFCPLMKTTWYDHVRGP